MYNQKKDGQQHKSSKCSFDKAHFVQENRGKPSGINNLVFILRVYLLKMHASPIQGIISQDLFLKDIFCSLPPYPEQNSRKITNFDPLGDRYLQTSFLSSGNRRAPEEGAFSGNQAKSPE